MPPRRPRSAPPVRYSEAAVDDGAIARMYDERVTARREGRRAYQMAAAYRALPLEPLTDAELERLQRDEGWTNGAVATLRSHIASGACPGPGYSVSTRSVFTADLTPSEFAPLAEEPEAVAAYQFMLDGTFHLRAMRRG